jgi:hypothetical protein
MLTMNDTGINHLHLPIGAPRRTWSIVQMNIACQINMMHLNPALQAFGAR